MFLRMYWKLNLLELLCGLLAIVFFGPSIRAAFLPSGVEILEQSDHRIIIELKLPAYHIETRRGTVSYSAITLEAPGWTTWRDLEAQSAAAPVLVYRLPATANAVHADLSVLEQESERQTIEYPLTQNGIRSSAGTNIRAYLDSSKNQPAIVIEWHPFSYLADSSQLIVQRRLKILIEN